MPVMDGIQATKEIRRLEATNANAGFPPLTPSTEDNKTPSEVSTTSSVSGEARSLNSPYRSSVIIVALTASSLQVDRVNALEAGCNDFLTKPVSLLWLNNKIIEWGSIKALQMYADVRPDARRTIASGQAEQARNVAERLHVPPRGRNTPSPPQRTNSLREENDAAIALASSSGSLFPPSQGPSRSVSIGNGPPSPTSTVFRTPPDQSSSPASSHYMTPPERSSSLDSSMLTNMLETKSLVREPPEAYDGNFYSILLYVFALTLFQTTVRILEHNISLLFINEAWRPVTPTSRISRSQSTHIGVPQRGQLGKSDPFTADSSDD